MENNTLIIGISTFIITYLVVKLLLKKQNPITNIYSDILDKEEYKVKGQWDK
jgi:hypothetical protein